MRELIIERPKLQTVAQKYTSITLTWFFWIVWIYIWTPFVTLVCWWLGIKFAYTEVFTYATFIVFLADVKSYFIAITILTAGLILWALYNFFRFKDSCRYKAPQDVNLEDISKYANIKKEFLEKYQTAKILSVRFDEQDELVEIRELEKPNNYNQREIK